MMADWEECNFLGWYRDKEGRGTCSIKNLTCDQGECIFIKIQKSLDDLPQAILNEPTKL